MLHRGIFSHKPLFSESASYVGKKLGVRRCFHEIESRVEGETASWSPVHWWLSTVPQPTAIIRRPVMKAEGNPQCNICYQKSFCTFNRKPNVAIGTPPPHPLGRDHQEESHHKIPVDSPSNIAGPKTNLVISRQIYIDPREGGWLKIYNLKTFKNLKIFV